MKKIILGILCVVMGCIQLIVGLVSGAIVIQEIGLTVFGLIALALMAASSFSFWVLLYWEVTQQQKKEDTNGK